MSQDQTTESEMAPASPARSPIRRPSYSTLTCTEGPDESLASSLVGSSVSVSLHEPRSVDSVCFPMGPLVPWAPIIRLASLPQDSSRST